MSAEPRFHHLGPFQLDRVGEVVEQPDARTKNDRRHVQVHAVDQSSPQRLLNHARAAHDVDLLLTGRSPGQGDRLPDALRDEGEDRAPLHHHVVRAMREHEHRPQRSESLTLLRQFTDTSIDISETVPGSTTEARAVTTSGQIQRQLWALAGQSLNMAPTDSAPRLYVESLNEMFDSQSRRIYSLGNRVPTPVRVLQVAGAAIALGALALHLATVGRRGVLTVMIAAGLVIVILLVTFDLDRPRRGLIRVPVSPLVQARAEMVPPPAASPPSH
jgi:hypothetical protein